MPRRVCGQSELARNFLAEKSYTLTRRQSALPFSHPEAHFPLPNSKRRLAHLSLWRQAIPHTCLHPAARPLGLPPVRERALYRHIRGRTRLDPCVV